MVINQQNIHTGTQANTKLKTCFWVFYTIQLQNGCSLSGFLQAICS